MSDAPMPIVTFNHPALTQVCTAVEPDEAVAFTASMVQALNGAVGGVGLGASQIAVLKRAIIINPRGKKPRVLINPVITSHGETQDVGPEGCLSYPGIDTDVKRWRVIEVTFEDLDRRPQRETFKGFAARVVQHEIDHLNGACPVGVAWRDGGRS